MLQESMFILRGHLLSTSQLSINSSSSSTAPALRPYVMKFAVQESKTKLLVSKKTQPPLFQQHVSDDCLRQTNPPGFRSNAAAAEKDKVFFTYQGLLPLKGSAIAALSRLILLKKPSKYSANQI